MRSRTLPGCWQNICSKLGCSHEFSVTDDGPGIHPELHDKIFGIFQTLESKHKNNNTGIGLAIVKKIIETEGGKIKLESQVSQGTTFRFTWLKQSCDCREY